MNKRLLIITCHKLDENNGGANASKAIIHCFASLFDDCSLIYPEFENTSHYIPSNYKLYPCHDSRTRLRKGIDMHRGVVGALYYCVKAHLKEHQYDIIVIDHSVTSTSLIRILKRTGAKMITIHHNVECTYLRDNGNERPITYRIPYNFFAKKAERDSLRFSDVNLTLTEQDAAVFRSWFNGICVRHWGTFQWQPIEEKIFTEKEVGQTFIITGSLGFLQSQFPISEFVRRYWPLVREVCKHARLIIAGRNPHQLLIEACAGQDDISIIPNPSDMGTLVEQADYYVCPINAGSGLKLRIMDALKQGLPVLCHQVSAAGYECMALNNGLFVYHEENSFKKALRKLLVTKTSRQAIYQAYKKQFSLEEGTAKLHTLLKEENII